jgi:signal transduction histidine kinase
MDEFPDISPECEVELYHIIVEAMNNIVKHAAATCLTLNMIRADRELQLRIADNGHGFDLSQTTGGLGLRNIRERVTRLNGQISIFSQPGQGTRLEAIIPYPLEEP